MYAKIFRQIYDSSIAENPELRFTFMDLLVLADSDGVVDMTHEAIARTTNRPLEIIKSTIAELESPDPQSRTPDANGARLRRLDDHRPWGWLILNYDKFRGLATDAERREQTRLRVQKYRQNIRKQASVTPDSVTCNAPVTQGNAHVTPPYASASVCTSESSCTGRGVQGGNILDQKREFELKTTIDYLTAALFKAYNRDPNRRLCNSEEPLIAEIARRPGAKRECDRILNWKSTIPPKELRYFPQSIERLLQAWSATLDKADAQLDLETHHGVTAQDRALKATLARIDACTRGL